MSDPIKDLMPYVTPLIAAAIGLVMGRPALTAGIIFLWYGTLHLFVNMFVCTYPLSYSPSPSPSPGTPPSVNRPDTSSDLNGWAMDQVRGFFAWSWIAFVTATVVASLAILSGFRTPLKPILSTLSIVYPKGIPAQLLLLGVGILGIVFNNIATSHTKSCDSREFDWMAEHNYIPIVGFVAGLILLFMGLSPKAQKRARDIYTRMKANYQAGRKAYRGRVALSALP